MLCVNVKIIKLFMCPINRVTLFIAGGEVIIDTRIANNYSLWYYKKRIKVTIVSVTSSINNKYNVKNMTFSKIVIILLSEIINLIAFKILI